ncbi:MAG: hypothetical protein WEC79_04130 [Thermomicrobiales bacterium]
MFRRILVGMVAIGGLVAAGLALLSRRGARSVSASTAVQWPFDAGELSTLMSRVVSEQRARVNSIADPAARERARSFLEYYERRRRAAAV